MLDLSRIAPETQRGLTRSEYEQLAKLGSFEGERIELIEGTIIRMSPTSSEHDGTVEQLTESLVRQVAGRARVRIRSSFAASDTSEPQPDIAVVPRGDYKRAHPTRALLIIEVANSSLAKDRDVKAALYARSNVAEYWIVNLVERVVEVFQDARDGSYTHRRTFLPGESVIAQSIEGVTLDVSEIFPRG